MARRTVAAAPTQPTPEPKDAATAITKGTAWLTDVLNKNLGTDYSGYQVRILIRKLVKNGVIERGEGRYEFTGLKDPRVLAIVKAAKEGGVKEAAAEKVEQAKASATRGRRPAAKPAVEEEEEAPKPAARRRGRPAAKPVVVEEDANDDDLDLDEL